MCHFGLPQYGELIATSSVGRKGEYPYWDAVAHSCCWLNQMVRDGYDDNTKSCHNRQVAELCPMRRWKFKVRRWTERCMYDQLSEVLRIWKRSSDPVFFCHSDTKD
jgi:hypothetical protein